MNNKLQMRLIIYTIYLQYHSMSRTNYLCKFSRHAFNTELTDKLSKALGISKLSFIADEADILESETAVTDDTSTTLTEITNKISRTYVKTIASLDYNEEKNNLLTKR
jgi:hypothetical protein